jgi:hypothetical protein
MAVRPERPRQREYLSEQVSAQWGAVPKCPRSAFLPQPKSQIRQSRGFGRSAPDRVQHPSLPPRSLMLLPARFAVLQNTAHRSAPQVQVSSPCPRRAVCTPGTNLFTNAGNARRCESSTVPATGGSDSGSGQGGFRRHSRWRAFTGPVCGELPRGNQLFRNRGGLRPRRHGQEEHRARAAGAAAWRRWTSTTTATRSFRQRV